MSKKSFADINNEESEPLNQRRSSIKNSNNSFTKPPRLTIKRSPSLIKRKKIN